MDNGPEYHVDNAPQRKRLPSDEHINDAREEADRARRSRQAAVRKYAHEVIDDLEADVLARASRAGISNPAEFLEYVEQLITGRVLERRLAP